MKRGSSLFFCFTDQLAHFSAHVSYIRYL